MVKEMAESDLETTTEYIENTREKKLKQLTIEEVIGLYIIDVATVCQ